MLRKIINLIKRIRNEMLHKRAARGGSTGYWSHHMVATEKFNDADSSIDHFEWRNAQYLGYIELMPVEGHDDKVILDYGCGPGNDLVGFSTFSTPKRLIGIDVSKPALLAAEQRLSLHNDAVEFVLVNEDENSIPIGSESIDLIHSSGVLHHCANLPAILKEFNRILRVKGELQIMVYNYESIWLHLITAFLYQIEKGEYTDETVLDAFKYTTDGKHCPISHCYTPEQFIAIVENYGFKGEFIGAAVSRIEMNVINRRFDAIANRKFPKEHRDFLSELTFDNRGLPYYQDSVAGIDACYKFIKI